MWIERLQYGVLRVLTPLGPRYLSPPFLERVYLLWTFRNFASLPLVVLNHRQQKLVARLCSQQKFVSLPLESGGFEQPLIGTVERLCPMHSHSRKPGARPDRLLPRFCRTLPLRGRIFEECKENARSRRC
jgi:hypothetical protein